jgi:hypothetical protein
MSAGYAPVSQNAPGPTNTITAHRGLCSKALLALSHRNIYRDILLTLVYSVTSTALTACKCVFCRGVEAFDLLFCQGTKEVMEDMRGR